MPFFYLGNVLGLLYLCGMKNPILKYILIFAVLFLARQNVLAQAKWVLVTGSASISDVEKHHVWSYCPGSSKDTSWSEISSIHLVSSSGGEASGFRNDYSRDNNKITYHHRYPSNGDPCGTGTETISFELDSIAGKLRSFFIDYNGPNYRDGCIRSYINISVVDFKIIDDTLVKVDFISEKTMSNGGYSYSSVYNCNGRGNTYGTEISSLSESTGAAYCSMTIVIDKAASAVSENRIPTKNLNLVVKYFSNEYRILFSFPNRTTLQPLMIYDVLGRQIKQFGIPFGATEYSIHSDQFQSGYYFARLGSLTTHFIVN